MSIQSLARTLIRRQKFLIPPQFRFLPRELRATEIKLLDVGCGNHSPTIARDWLPQVRYYGLDRVIYNNDEADLGSMEKMYEIDIQTDSLEEIPNEFFDLIVFNHVIEHVRNGLEILQQLAAKLKPGGKIYVEFPGVRSLALPSIPNTLQFCDDPTHVRVYSVQEVANTLLAHNIQILKAGTRRVWLRIILLPITLPITYLKGNPAVALWDLLGFGEYVYGRKRT